MGGATSALLVKHSPYDLQRITPLGLWGFRTRRSAPPSFLDGSPSLEIRPPVKSTHENLAADRSHDRLPLMELAPLRRNGRAKYTYTRRCLPCCVPPSGFLNLLTAYSSARRTALFHAACTRGVLPFRAFPSQGAASPPGDRCPVVTAVTNLPSEEGGPMALPPSGRCSP
jgi:hypothetical protein